MRDKTVDDGWRIHPGILYPLLMKLESDAFHTGEVGKKSMRPILTVCNTENESTITDAIYTCKKPYYGFVCHTIQNGFKNF